MDVGRAALITAGAAAATFAVDHGLKVAVEHALDEGEHASGPLGIQLIRRTNDRGMTGSGDDGTHAGVLVAAGGALALGIAGAGVLARRPLAVQLGAGLVAGGMAANLVDRAIGPGVTDYLPSPLGVLNAADVAIGTGIIIAGLGLAVRR